MGRWGKSGQEETVNRKVFKGSGGFDKWGDARLSWGRCGHARQVGGMFRHKLGRIRENTWAIRSQRGAGTKLKR